LKGYKFIPCHHCGRYFVARTKKVKYCKRPSPYINELSQKSEDFKKRRFKNKTCVEVVHDTRNFLKRKANEIDAKMRNSTKILNLERNDPHNERKFHYDFKENCCNYMKTIRNAPTPENFEKYAEYLSKVDKAKEWIK
jgi:hypothetical protein